MPAAIAIPIIAGAGASVAGSAIQAHAAGKAAKSQEDAARQAQAFNQRVYDDQMRMVNPYVQFGTQSLANLGRLRDTPFSEQTNGMVSAARGGGIPAYQLGDNGGRGVPLGQMGQPAQPPQPQPMILRAPTGETMPVHDPQMAQQLIARGAQRVG